MARALSGVILGGVALLTAGTAMAQQAVANAPSQSMFERDRNVSVSQRPHPGYESAPLPLGAFTGMPKIDVGVEENDNIYASQTAKSSDTIFTINPEFDLSSNWSRNALQAYIRSASREYTRFNSESTTDWQLGGSGRLDAGRGALTAGGDTGEFTEPRSSTNTSRTSTHPIRYYQSDAFVGAQQEFNRVRLTGRVDFQNLDYQNGTDSTGAQVFEKDRDRKITTVSGKAEYALSPATAVFFDASYNEHRYDLIPPAVLLNRNSQGGEFDVGANFDLSHVARGEVQVGYLKQDFVSTFGSISGLSALGKVEWFPNQLTTVTLTGSRGVQDAAITGSPAYIAEIASLQADHELLRNLILTGRVGFEDDNYNGVDRKDRNANAYVAAKYLLNRVVGLTLSYTYLDQDSSGAAKGPKYTINRLMASTTLQF
jgi:hypothetical protein